MAQNVIRDMLTWSDFTPGLITTGGTVLAPNQYAAAIPNFITVNTTTGMLSANVPSVVAGTTRWLLTLTISIECMAPVAMPNAIQPLVCQLTNQTLISGNTYFSDFDSGNFIAFNGDNQTGITIYRAVVDPGTNLSWNIFTNGIALLDISGALAHRKLHVLLDAVAA